MEDEISSILVSIKKRSCNLKASHRSHYLCLLKNEETLGELFESEGDIDVEWPSSNVKQVPLIYRNLFNDKYATIKRFSSSNTILLRGEAGVGKTMLCISIVEDWATGNLFQEFQMILLLPLRNVASVCSLLELLTVLYPDFNSDTCTKLATYLEKNEEHNILIIADGWEDLQSSQCQKESFLHSFLFSNDIIPTSTATVLITTASPSCIQTHTLELIDRFITLSGFNKTAIESIIQSEFEGDIRMIRYLTAQLHNNPLITSVCSTPLHLAILCDKCRLNVNAEPLPKTMTELYAKLVWTLATMNINSAYAKILSLSKYSDLPEDLKGPWQLLCEVAFRNVEKGHDVFFQSDALKFISSELKKNSYFGLIKPMSESEDNLSFSFVHPYFEQYLASLHLVLQPLEVQLTCIKELSVNVEYDSRVSTIFWYFFIHNYASMVRSVNPDIVAQVLKHISTMNCSTKGSYINNLCHLSFEAKNLIVNELIIKVMHNLDKMVLKFGHCHNVHDCIAMTYVIENIVQEYEVEINFQDCCLSPEHINSLANALGSNSTLVQVGGLNLSGNKLNNSLTVDFFSRAAAVFKSLRILVLHNCEIGTSFDIQAILAALTDSSCQTLTHFDLSHNPISMSFLQILQGHIQSSNTFDGLQNLYLKGSLKSDFSVSFLSCFSDTLASRCKYLRRLDLSDNHLGQPGNPDLCKMISQLLSLGRDFHLCLNEEYMSEVNNEFVYVMEETIKKKGTINHIIVHGVIVGPGRSGKNTLMSRLMGSGPPEPDSTSPSTGVLENIIKVEVKKLFTVATAVSNLEWMKLEHDEEALELIMTTARHHSAPARISKPTALKYVLKEPKEDLIKVIESAHPPKHVVASKWGKIKHKISKGFKFRKFKLKIGKKCRDSIGKDQGSQRSNAVVYRPDVEPVDIFKRAVKLRGMDALREHLESSWSLYLTNTGGQIEFQEYLPLLVCGPSIFFVIFPLHCDLEKPYNVRYEYPDGREEEYKSPGTLLEELLQTLATINASNFTSGQQRNSGTGIKPKIFFVGTHKDCLSADIAKESIQNKDKLLQAYVKRTSLYRQGSIQFAQAPDQLIFTVNNLSNDDDEFRRIRSAVQRTVERNRFTVECPSSWLILSLILRAKHKSDQVLSFEKCYSIAQECGITNHTELKQALSFIHTKLGLIRYFNIDDLNTLVIIDPQILFDRITDLIVETFTSNNVEANEIEDFHHKGIIPLTVMKRLSDKNHSNSQLPFTWLTKLLNYLRIAALYTDGDGDKYFFPSALCHAPTPQSNQSSLNLWPPLLIGFESGFCPRGIPGALMKYLMTNEMKSRKKWEIIPHKIFRNQVSFAIQAHEIITLKILPTHMELSAQCEGESIDSNCSDSDVISTENELIKKTCKIAYAQIMQGMTTVTEQCNECNFYFGFYCTLASTCKVQHPAEIQWGDKSPFKLKCEVTGKRGNLPKGYEIWSLQKDPNSGKIQLLYKEIDACNNGVPKHLGQIADFITEWEGRISDELLLTPANVAEIQTQYPNKLKLQTRAALRMWKEKLGPRATYQKLIDVFESAGYHAYAETVKNIACHIEGEMDGSNDYTEPLSQPETYPQPKPNPPSSPKLITRQSSSYDEFLQINSADVRDLPEGDIYGQNVLESYNVSTVPLLSSKEPEVNKPVEPAPSSPRPEATELDHQQWFFTNATRREAEQWLMMPCNQHGSYLIRNSESNPGGYSLSVRNGQTVSHYKIQQVLEDGTFFISTRACFKSIIDLVSHYQNEADGLTVKLINPCNVEEPTDNNWEIDRRQIKLIKKVWEGEFSELWEGLWTGVKVAIKKQKSKIMTQSDFLQMACLMKKLCHRRIVKLYGMCSREEPIYIIIEHTKHGSLLDYLHSEARLKLSLSQLINMTIQVAEGMAYLEDQNCILRDLAARNILVGEKLNCKLANFETAREIDKGGIFEAHNEVTFLLSKWTAPEAATYVQNKFSIKSDVWSFGIFLYEVITYGQDPYPRMSNAQAFEFVQSGNRMSRPEECPREIYRIMLHCWEQNPENRPTFGILQLQLHDYDSEKDPQHAIFAAPAEVLQDKYN